MRAEYIDPAVVCAMKARLNAREWLPFAVALETGLRVGDVVKIRVEDLTADGVRYVSQKTGAAGFAPLSRATVNALRDGAKWGWCFPSPYKCECHLTRQAVWARVKRAARRAGVDPKGKSPHSARKNFAVGVANTEGLAVAAAKLQHKRLDVTELYALSDWTTGANADLPLLRRDLQKIVEKLVGMLGII